MGTTKTAGTHQTQVQNPPVMIHENGYSTKGDDSSNPAARNDTDRIECLQAYIGSVHLSIRNVSNVGGYFVWSFLDCFEWGGYTLRYGLYEDDFRDKDRKRYPRPVSSLVFYVFSKEREGRRKQLAGCLTAASLKP